MLNNIKSMFGEDKVNEALSYFSSDSGNGNGSNNIDMETMLKMKSVIDRFNSSSDSPRSNLLNSIKPYMRDSRKEYIDKYANLLKMADLASLFNDESSGNNSNV